MVSRGWRSDEGECAEVPSLDGGCPRTCFCSTHGMPPVTLQEFCFVTTPVLVEFMRLLISAVKIRRHNQCSH